MFRLYDHLQVEIYSSEINMTGFSIVVYSFIQIVRYMFRSYYHLQASHVNFWCIYTYTYFRLNIVLQLKHLSDNLNKIVNNYWNRVALDGNPWTWSNTRSRMQTPKSKCKLCQSLCVCVCVCVCVCARVRVRACVRAYIYIYIYIYWRKWVAVHCSSEAMCEISEEHTAFFFLTEDKTSLLKTEAICVIWNVYHLQDCMVP
jgi:hypothetical protein